jgi:hypothetical protein
MHPLTKEHQKRAQGPLRVRRAVVLGALFVCAGVMGFLVVDGGTPVDARQPQRPVLPAGAPDLEGGWTRIDPDGAGSYGGLLQSPAYQQAVLVPGAAASAGGRGGRGRGGAGRGAGVGAGNDDVAPPLKPNPVGVPYVVTAGRCGGGGPGAAMLEFNSAAFFLLQAADRVLIVREGPGARPIFMDGRPHPDPARATPTPNGFSTGRYENGELVVETDNLAAGAVTLGGFRTPETKLIQRFALSAEGKRLTITYIWNDPKIYAKPHTYQMFFERVPPDGYAFENWCDASDPETGYSITPPAQLPDR